MRISVLIGAIAGLLLGGAIVAFVLASALAEPPLAPTPTVPSLPPVAVPTLEPTDSPVPTSTAGPTASPTDSGEPGEPTEPPEGIGLGQEAPRIVLPALGGGTFDTAQYTGRPLWINFMATWCPQCVDELPMMELMQEQLGDGMSIVIVDVGEEEELVADFISDIGSTLPVGIDSDSAIQREWGAYALPVHFWVDEEGVIRSILYGGAPRDAFVESVLNLVPDADLGE
jgi:thiol-disulfide isomerase/thioredoxin